jgi:hypothetical protein
MRGIEAVLGDSLDCQSLPLPVALHPRFVYVSAPIRPMPEYCDVAERVRQSPIPGVNPDTILQFASIGYPMGPRTQEVPLIVTGLVPLAIDIADVKDYVQATAAPVTAAAKLPESVAPRISIDEQYADLRTHRPLIAAASDGQKG